MKTAYLITDYHLIKKKKNIVSFDYTDLTIEEFINSYFIYLNEIVKINNIFYVIKAKEKVVSLKREPKFFMGNKEITIKEKK